MEVAFVPWSLHPFPFFKLSRSPSSPFSPFENSFPLPTKNEFRFPQELPFTLLLQNHSGFRFFPFFESPAFERVGFLPLLSHLQFSASSAFRLFESRIIYVTSVSTCVLIFSFLPFHIGVTSPAPCFDREYVRPVGFDKM